MTTIPTRAELDLFRLFDAALHARPYSLDIAESLTPGAAAALRAWSSAVGIPSHDKIFAGLGGNDPAYVNLHVQIGSTRIVVLSYRVATAEETAALTQRAGRGSE